MFKVIKYFYADPSVLKHMNERDLSEETTIKIYYPFLATKYFSFDEFNEINSLIRDSKTCIKQIY